MTISLYKHQIDAVRQLETGSILCGGVGSGKSRTSLVYFYTRVCGGGLNINGVGEPYPMKRPRDLYIITTARKRDSLDWEEEALKFGLFPDRENSREGVMLTVDSWNNIGKYTQIRNAFFILDEQRLVGSGAWVKSFLAIAKNNSWILLSGTPGDTWMDYIPVFVANGFYKNRTEFLREHAVYNRYSKYPKVDRWMGVERLERHRKDILVEMPFERHTTRHTKNEIVTYDKDLFNVVMKDRWNPWKQRPIRESGEYFHAMRKVVNSDLSRLAKIVDLTMAHDRLIVFYNFDYELEILRILPDILEIPVAELNGHKHDDLPEGDRWVYLVQYTSGSEAWNCTTTNAIAFYSLNYSYRVLEQAKGRIDRLDTEYEDLYYYMLRSMAPIDLAIVKALARKQNFNEKSFKQPKGK